MNDIIRNLQGRFERPANDLDEREILQALKDDPNPRVTARYVIVEQERRRKPIGSPGRYIAGRIGAARRGEIDVSISGGAPAPHGAFSTPEAKDALDWWNGTGRYARSHESQERTEP
jgi:hypothetical protein